MSSVTLLFPDDGRLIGGLTVTERAERAARDGGLPADRTLLLTEPVVFDAEAVRSLAAVPGTVVTAAAGLVVTDAGTTWDTVTRALERGDTVKTDATGFVAAAGDPAAAERALWSRYCFKPSDGPVLRANRRLSRRLTLALVRTSVSSDTVSVASFLVVALGALLIGQGTWSATAAGGLLVQAGFVLDCVDGQMARLRLRSSRRGALIDTILDRYADLVVIAALTVAAGGGPAEWAWGFAAGAASMLVPYINALNADAPRRLLRRPERILLCAAAAVAGAPLAALAVIAVLGNIDAARVFYLLVRATPDGS
ncbi:CDP-alcohol phosphatidyltransferase family protein [Sphaerisporangium sp. B11E5]|uniref:CDP-alcohol phosphatidyltransferase family protein n=1 Tax=Sphaerisporangium sp. B11E5 TaxID=3153563 RepID=UPI00325E1D6A